MTVCENKKMCLINIFNIKFNLCFFLSLIFFLLVVSHRLCLCPSFGDTPGAGEKGKGFRASLQQIHLQELKSCPVSGESQCSEGPQGRVFQSQAGASDRTSHLPSSFVSPLQPEGASTGSSLGALGSCPESPAGNMTLPWKS